MTEGPPKPPAQENSAKEITSTEVEAELRNLNGAHPYSSPLFNAWKEQREQVERRGQYETSSVINEVAVVLANTGHYEQAINNYLDLIDWAELVEAYGNAQIYRGVVQNLKKGIWENN